MHNINGIKGSFTKLELLLEQVVCKNLDIIGINETNTMERQNKFNMKKQKDFFRVWTDSEEKKKKGSGVGLLINNKWERHLSQVKRISAYYIEALFIFKRQKMLIIAIYIPHNDKETRREIQHQVIRRCNECTRKGTKIIVLGDFNDIRNKELDQNRKESRHTSKLPLLAQFESSRMIDSFRLLHPNVKKFSRLNSIVNSRIDYIWLSRELEQGLVYCDIIKADTITDSDHSIVVTTLLTRIINKPRSLAYNKRLKSK